MSKRPTSPIPPDHQTSGERPSPFPADYQTSGIVVPSQTAVCCICGGAMPPNPANMCAPCLRSWADVTDGLPRRASVVYCPQCHSFLQATGLWLKLEPDSEEFVAFFRRHLKPTFRPVRLVHAEIVWAGTHSTRLQLRVHVQGEALNGVVLEHTHVVEFAVQHRLCDSCYRAQANPDHWTAVVQLRQHIPHRRTFFYLEQLVVRHGAAARCLRIVKAQRGLDFFFGSRSHAQRFADFVSDVAPVQPPARSDDRLVSHDPTSNLHTFSVEICPICRDDLVCLPPDVAIALGNLGPLVLCAKVTNTVALIDPWTLRCGFLDAGQYWRAPFAALLTSRQLVKYIVLDVKALPAEVSIGRSKYALAIARVARTSDFGKNDKTVAVRTHLGHLLRPGDYALGYDLVLPGAILVKKTYEGRPKRLHAEYRKFKKDLEQDPARRFGINLPEEKDDGDLPPLDELFAVLDLSDEDDGDDTIMRD